MAKKSGLHARPWTFVTPHLDPRAPHKNRSTPVKDTPPRGLVAHAMRGKPGNKPVYAWDSPNQRDSSLPDGKYNGIVCVNEDNMFEEKACQQQQQQQQQQPSFYDREALQEKLHDLEVEGSSLSERESELRERLEKAQATLSSMRSQKRQLSTAKLLAQVDSKAGGSTHCSSDKQRQRPCLSRDGILSRQQEEHRKDGRSHRQDDNNVRLYFRDCDVWLVYAVEHNAPEKRHTCAIIPL